MVDLFRSIPIQAPKRNFFNLSHEVKTTTELMRLCPIFKEKVVPNDIFKVSTEIMCRMLATVAPIMHRIDIFTHYFFIPLRLLYDDFEKYISGGKNGQYDVPRPLVNLGVLYETLSLGGIDNATIRHIFGYGSLLDYLGYPVQHWTNLDNTINFAVLKNFDVPYAPFLAFFKVFCDYYNDENFGLQQWEDYEDLGITTVAFWSKFKKGVRPAKLSDDLQSAVISIFNRHNRAWQKDYFTSALPWQQRGPNVSVPVGFSNAPITSYDVLFRSHSGVPFPSFVRLDDGSAPALGKLQTADRGSGSFINVDNQADKSLAYNPKGSLYVNVPQGAGGVGELLIQELRRTMKVQEFFEKDARGGYRYAEVLPSHFGIRSRDSRLQRAEYLGGGKSPLVVMQIANTSSGDESNPQGNLAGIGVSRQKTHQFKYRVPEHGIILGIMSIMPKANYMDGVRREFYATSRFQEYWPSFANLGEQPIQPFELYMPAGVTDIDDSTNPFGYTPRYAEYKHRNDEINGYFRGNLKFWHLGRSFSSTPTLGQTFIYGEPNPDRIFATSSEYPMSQDHFLCQIYHTVRTVRPMPKWGVPTL